MIIEKGFKYNEVHDKIVPIHSYFDKYDNLITYEESWYCNENKVIHTMNDKKQCKVCKELK